MLKGARYRERQQGRIKKYMIDIPRMHLTGKAILVSGAPAGVGQTKGGESRATLTVEVPKDCEAVAQASLPGNPAADLRKLSSKGPASSRRRLERSRCAPGLQVHAHQRHLAPLAWKQGHHGAAPQAVAGRDDREVRLAAMRNPCAYRESIILRMNALGKTKLRTWKYEACSGGTIGLLKSNYVCVQQSRIVRERFEVRVRAFKPVSDVTWDSPGSARGCVVGSPAACAQGFEIARRDQPLEIPRGELQGRMTSRRRLTCKSLALGGCTARDGESRRCSEAK